MKYAFHTILASSLILCGCLKNTSFLEMLKTSSSKNQLVYNSNIKFNDSLDDIEKYLGEPVSLINNEGNGIYNYKTFYIGVNDLFDLNENTNTYFKKEGQKYQCIEFVYPIIEKKIACSEVIDVFGNDFIKYYSNDEGKYMIVYKNLTNTIIFQAAEQPMIMDGINPPIIPEFDLAIEIEYVFVYRKK